MTDQSPRNDELTAISERVRAIEKLLEINGLVLREAPGVEMEPFFQSTQTSRLILKLLPVDRQRKWRFFFSDWGCLRCGRGENEGLCHAGNGFCVECRPLIYSRLMASVQSRAAENAMITAEEAIARHRRRPLTADHLAQFTPDTIMEPWFLSKQIETAITQLVPISKRRKWVYFFQDHGCLRCDRKTRKHHCLGLCKRCHLWVHYHLGASIKRHFDSGGPSPDHLTARLTLRADTAQRILAGDEVLPLATEPEQTAERRSIHDVWKKRLGRGCARMIDALDNRGELSTSEIAAITGLTLRTVQLNLESLRRNTLIETRYGRHVLRTPCEECRQLRQTLFHRKNGRGATHLVQGKEGRT